MKERSKDQKSCHLSPSEVEEIICKWFDLQDKPIRSLSLDYEYSMYADESDRDFNGFDIEFK